MFIPQNEANIPQFITKTIDLLDILSISEIERRLYIFNETLKVIEQQMEEEEYIIFERAFREVQNRLE